MRERTEGKTAYVIARDLNKDAVPTAQGACAWSQATVRALLMREAFIDNGHRGLRRLQSEDDPYAELGWSVRRISRRTTERSNNPLVATRS